MIARAHQQCGHIMMFCTNCFATGCNNHKCENSIGNGNASICKHCGARAVVTNSRRNEIAKTRKFEGIKHDQDIERRLQELEKVNGIVFQTHTRRSVHMPSGSLLSWTVFFGVCWAISKVVDYKQFEGILGFVLGIVHICGALAELPIAILKSIIF